MRKRCQSPANRIILKSVMFSMYLMQRMGKGWILLSLETMCVYHRYKMYIKWERKG